MVRLVDVPLDAGDPVRAITEINEAIKESRSQATTDSRATTQATTTTTQSDTSVSDPRFAGKSAAEIYNAYKNLESHSGRLANQLDEARRAANQLILGKRENDLRAGSGERAKITPADFMVDPTNALDRYFQERANPEVSALKERLAQLEGQLTQTVFTVNHPKASDITQDPEFAAWVRQTPLRSVLADAAAKGDLAQADLLLKEWQHTQTQKTSAPSTANERAKDLAKSVALESTTVGSENGDGKSSRRARTFSRRDLQALRIRDPDKYESQELQNEIVKAYVEGRIVD